jgi:MFS family permease
MAMVQLTVHVAAPFFTPFMLRELRFSYGQYVSLIATSFVAKAICLPALGGLAQKYGARWLLWVGGVGIVPLAGLWVISNAYAYLLGVQLFGGVVWAAYELATFLLFFETIPPEQRTGTLTVFNLVNAVAMVGGSFVGAGIMMALGQGVSAYITVFGVSTLGRAAALAILPGMPKVHVQLVSLARRTVALRPSSGSMDRPILPSIVNTFTDEDRD